MPRHPVFIKYTRDWLHEVTGFSKGYLSRVATGSVPLSRSFIERVCFKLNEPEAELFLPEVGESTPSQHTAGNNKPQGGQPSVVTRQKWQMLNKEG